MFNKHTIILLFILLIASILRLYQLGSIPSGFHADEAAFGYNAYSILLTGKDEYGKFMPLTLRSFDDYKGAIYSYIDIPFIGLFGLTEFAVRAPSAVFGVLLVFLAYMVSYKLSKERNFALLAAALVAISPISILLSRVQSDPLVAVFFVILGYYFFLLWLEKDNIIYLILNSALWFISFFTYASPRVFLPVFVFILFIFYFKKFSLKQKYSFLILAALVILTGAVLIFGNSGQRFNQLNIFNTPQVMLPLEEQIREDGTFSPIFLTRLFHNKMLDYSRYLIDNFSQYLSFNFLFIKGGLPSREIIPNTAFLYLVEFPFLIFGLYKIFSRKIKWGYFIVLWLLAVPAVLSFAADETPNVHRFYLAILPLEMIVSFGVIQLFKSIKTNKVLYLLFIILVLVFYAQNLSYFMHQLFVHQPVHRPWNRGFAYKEMVVSLNKYSPEYKKIVITKSLSSPYIYLLFYSIYDPKKYQQMGSPRDYEYKGFDKYIFSPNDCPLSAGEKGLDPIRGEVGVLYVNKGDCLLPKYDVKLLKTIKWKDGSSAFKLAEYKPKKKNK